MLKCKDVAARASALIDGELPFWDVLQIRLHLAICKGCTAFIQQMRVTKSLTLAAANTGTSTDDAAMAAILARFHAEKPAGD